MKKFIALMSTVVMLCALATTSAFAEGHLYKRCAGCHGTDGSRQAMGVSAPLKGQSSEELEQKMLGYLDGSYGGAKKMIMTNTLKKLSPEQIKELADHIAGF